MVTFQIQDQFIEQKLKTEYKGNINNFISKVRDLFEKEERELKARKESIKNDFVEAFREVELMKKGELEETDLKDLIKELKQNV